MNYYTVVLLYPDWAADQYGEDSYTAKVRLPRPSVQGAIEAAQIQAFEAWAAGQHEKPDELIEQGKSPFDFFALVVFEGHHDPVGWGWQWKES